MPGDTVGPHVTDDLPRLLTGEATLDEVTAAAPHLRLCAECRSDLISAAAAHGLLLSVRNDLGGDTGLERPGPPVLRLLSREFLDEQDPAE